MLDNGPHLSPGTFVPWEVLSLGTFCPLDILSVGRFVPWDVLSLGTFCLRKFWMCIAQFIVISSSGGGGQGPLGCTWLVSHKSSSETAD